MSRTEKWRQVKARLYRDQRGLCHWCRRRMLRSWQHQDGVKPPASLATIDHLHNKLDYGPLRKERYGKNGRADNAEVVLACLACNEKRGAERSREWEGNDTKSSSYELSEGSTG